MLKLEDIPGLDRIIDTAVEFPIKELKAFMADALSAAGLSPENKTIPRDVALTVMFAVAEEMYGRGLLAGATAGVAFAEQAARAELARRGGATIQ